MPRQKGQVNKTYVPLDVTKLEVRQAQAHELADLAPKPRGRAAAERSDTQKYFDNLVQKTYEYWTKHGQPEPFSDDYLPMKVTVDDAAQADSVRMNVRGSAGFLNHGVRFGTDNKTVTGQITVSFCVTDKAERKPRQSKVAE